MKKPHRSLPIYITLLATALAAWGAPPQAPPKTTPTARPKAPPTGRRAASPSAAPVQPPADGWPLLLLSRHTEAKAAFAARLKQNPADLESTIGLAAILELEGKPEAEIDTLLAGLSKKPDGPLAPGAFAQLFHILGGAGDDGRRALPLLTKLADRSFPGADPEVRSLAIATLGETYARNEAPAEALAAFQKRAGRPTEWTLLGPYGRFERLDIFRPWPPEKGDFAASIGEPAADGINRLRISTSFVDGRVLIPDQFRQFGVIYAVTEFELPRAASARVRLQTNSTCRLFIDGGEALVFNRFQEHLPQSLAVRAAFSPGRHRLLVKLANEQALNDFALGLEWEGTPLPPAPVFEPPRSGPLSGSAVITPLPIQAHQFRPIPPKDSPAAVLATSWWLSLANLDEQVGMLLEEACRAWPKAALFSAALGEWRLAARTGKAMEEDLAQARTHLEAALTADPNLVRPQILLARMNLEGGQVTEAWQALDQLLNRSSENVEALIQRHMAALRRGWSIEAGNALERALALAPNRIDLLDLAGDYYRKIGAGAKYARVRRAQSRRDLFFPGWAAYQAEIGHIAEAEAEYRRLIELRPWYWQLHSGLARTLVDAGRLEDALTVLDRAIGQFAEVNELLNQRAGVLAALGREKEAEESLRRSIALAPAQLTTQESLFRRGMPDPLAPYLGQADEVLRSAHQPRPGTDSALLSDVAVNFIDRQGGQTELYQGIHAVYTRAGVEHEGELEILPGALLQGIRIHKPDGRYSDVALGDKRPISLPGLEPGDAFEYVWRRYTPGIERAPGAIDNQTLWLFQNTDREYVLSRYVIVHDQNLPVEVCGNTKGVTFSDETKDGLRLRSWTGRQMARISPEPHIADQQEVLPHIRLGLGLTWEEIGDLVRSYLSSSLIPDAPLPSLAQEIRSRAGANAKSLALAHALHDVVREKLRPGANPLSLGYPASMAASAGEGNRIGVALALAQMLGLDARLILTRPIEYRGRALDCPSIGTFGYPLLELVVDGQAVFLDYKDADLPFDSIPPRFSQADALEIPFDLASKARIIELPRRDPGLLQETVADVTMDGEGQVEGTLTITAKGVLASVVRRLLREAPAPQQPEILRGIAADSFPGAEVLESDIRGKELLDGDLTVKMKIRGGGWGRRTPTGFALPVASKPLGLFNEYASLPLRTFPLLVDEATFRRDEFRIRLPEGLLPTVVPSPATLLESFGVFTLMVRAEAGTVVATRQAAIPPVRIEPNDYPAFREFARKIEEAESREILVSVASPSLQRPR